MTQTNHPGIVVAQSRASGVATTYAFPPANDITQNRMILKIFKYERGNPQQAPREAAVATISLPIPQSGLEDNTNLNFEEEAMGGLVGGMLGLAGKSATLGESLKAGAQGLVKTLAKGVAQRNADLLPGAATAVEIGSGIAINQNIGITFKGVKIRKHDFSWTLTPTSLEESRELERILMFLKQKVLPEAGANFTFEYPHIAYIEFLPRNYIKISKMGCFITDMKINFAPGGTPAFFKGDEAHPAAIELMLSFTERAVMTSQDYNNGLFSASRGI